MKIEYDIPHEKSKFLTDNAKEELNKKSREHTLALLYEASRIEASFRNKNGNAEITSTFIEQASISFTKNTFKMKKKKLLHRLLALVNFAAATCSGIFMDKLKPFPSEISDTLCWFILIFTVSIATGVFQILKTE